MREMKISCIICAYNEAPRIGTVLAAAVDHPDVAEVIVVNDASTDETSVVVKKFPSVRLIDLAKNGGKSKALVHGFREAKGDHIMLLDADLIGITPSDIAALAAPVISDVADITISLRKNAFAIHHFLGLDFTSGERVVPKSLLADVLQEIDALPHFGIEAYMNSLIIKRHLRVAVVNWGKVSHTRKATKYGFIRGTLGDLRMSLDVLRTLSPLGIIRQNRRLLKLIKHAPNSSLTKHIL